MGYSLPASCPEPAASWLLLAMLLLDINSETRGQVYCKLVQEQLIAQNCNFDGSLPDFLERAGKVLGKKAPNLIPDKITITRANATGLPNWPDLKEQWQGEWTKNQIGFVVRQKNKKFFVGTSQIHQLVDNGQYQKWEVW